MNTEKLYTELKALAEEAKEIMRAVFASDLGINRHKNVNKNTLVNSHLYEDTESNYLDNGGTFINVIVNDYIQYIESGRIKHKFPPPEAIAEWASEKLGISDNEIVMKICWSIYWNGITARPLIDVSGGFWEQIDKIWDEWADRIYKAVTEPIDEIFNE